MVAKISCIRCGSATQQLHNLLLVARLAQMVARSSNFLNFLANKNNSTNQKPLFIKKQNIEGCVIAETRYHQRMSGNRPSNDIKMIIVLTSNLSSSPVHLHPLSWLPHTTCSESIIRCNITFDTSCGRNNNNKKNVIAMRIIHKMPLRILNKILLLFTTF